MRNRWSLGTEWKEHTEGVDYWKNRTAQVQAEVLGGQDGNNKSIGAYATLCVPVWKGLDVIASADYFNYNRELGMGQMNFVGGVQYCAIIMAVLTAIYVILGGYRATAMNDFVQGIIMLFGICAVIAAVLASKGGFVEATQSMAAIPSDADPNVNGGFATLFGPDPWSLLGVIILTSLGRIVLERSNTSIGVGMLYLGCWNNSR